MPIVITQSGYRGETDKVPDYIKSMTVPLPDEPGIKKTVDTKTGDMLIHNADGSITIDSKKSGSKRENSKFDDNLAEDMSEMDLSLIASDLLQGIEDDISSRSDWENTYKRGIDLLGLKIEDPSGDVVSGSVSKVWHPLLLEAVVRGQSNAMAELLPASGPVKVRDDEPEETPPILPAMQPMPPIGGAPQGIAGVGDNGGPQIDRAQLADAFEKDFNHYLTVVDKPYYSDFDRMLFLLYFCGCTFRKVYSDPLLKRPVSRYINPIDFIVSNEAITLDDAVRKTHRIRMRRSTVKRMQINGQWRKCDMQTPNQVLTDVEKKERSLSGQTDVSPRLQSDNRHEIYECYTEIDLPGYEHDEGLPLPYRVTLDKDSQQVLEIRRNWKEDDEDYRERRRFVKYGVVPGLGFYDYGYVHLLGNTTRALTGIERLLLDAGMFNSFPGFLLSKQGQRQETTVIRLAPGTGQEIETGGLPIQDVCMPLPYKEPSATLLALGNTIATDGRKLGSTAEIPVGEGAADVPVGTVLAMIEQGTKVMAAAHKRQHASQQEEFELLRELFIEDPSSLWKFAKKPQREWEQVEEFSDLELVPASDPNVPSHIHRIMQATAVMQIVDKLPNGNKEEAARRAFRILGIQDMEALFLPPAPPSQAPGITPADMAKAQELKLKDQGMQQNAAAKVQENQREAAETVMNNQIKMEELRIKVADNAAQRQNDLQIEQMQLQEQRLRSNNDDNSGGINS